MNAFSPSKPSKYQENGGGGGDLQAAKTKQRGGGVLSWARVVPNKREGMMVNKMVVAVLSWEWRCGGGGQLGFSDDGDIETERER